MMITDGKCFQFPKDKKQTLCSELLISSMLDKLLEKEVINIKTYQNAIKEEKRHG